MKTLNSRAINPKDIISNLEELGINTTLLKELSYKEHPELGLLEKIKGMYYYDGGSQGYKTERGEIIIQLNELEGEYNGRFVTYESFKNPKNIDGVRHYEFVDTKNYENNT